MQLRRLTPSGITAFRGYLETLAANPSTPVPEGWLQEPSMSEHVPHDVSLARTGFTSRLAVGQQLCNWVESSGISNPENDAGLWTWLSLFLFDTVCPPNGNGMRKPGKYNRHIAETGNWQKRHRHLLLSPFLVYRAHRDRPDRAMSLLWQRVDKPGDVVTQITERQQYWSNRGIVEAATKLYYDPTRGRDSVGAQSKTKGGARRFADLLNQLDLTWHLYGMNADQLLTFLPKEFDRFKQSA